MYHSTGVNVSVTGREDLSYSSVSSISINEAFLSISRLDEKAQNAGGLNDGQLSWKGAHFDFVFSAQFVLRALEQTKTRYALTGPYLGSMNENWGYAAADLGTGTSEIQKLDATFRTSADRLIFDLSGEFSDCTPLSRAKGRNGPAPTKFDIRGEVPIVDVPLLFGPANLKELASKLIKKLSG